MSSWFASNRRFLRPLIHYPIFLVVITVYVLVLQWKVFPAEAVVWCAWLTRLYWSPPSIRTLSFLASMFTFLTGK